MIIKTLHFLIPTAAIALLTLTACGKKGSDAAYDREKVVAIMTNLDKQADVIWGNSGSEWDSEGEHDLFPTTEAEWQPLAKAGEEMVLIAQDLRKQINKDDPRSEAWIAYADGMVEVSQKLVMAAQEQDKKAIFDDGGVLYQVCTACHGTFPTPEEQAK